MALGFDRGGPTIITDDDLASRAEAACRRISDRVWQCLAWLDAHERGEHPSAVQARRALKEME
jgi:hypothetical protein